MHRHRIASFACLAFVATFVACHKDKPAPVVPKTTEEVSAPVETASGVTASPTPAAPDLDVPIKEAPPVEPAPTAPPVEIKGAVGAAAAEAATAKPEEKPAVGKEEPQAETKKPGKKKSGDKAADAPAKETKPKFTELGIEVKKTGSGAAATTGRHVTINYKASVADAEKPFDSTFASNRPLEVDLAVGAKLKVIEGLRRGLEGLMPGSEVRLQIPASMAWGEKGNPAVGVPANADVVFEVQVLDVQ